MTAIITPTRAQFTFLLNPLAYMFRPLRAKSELCTCWCDYCCHIQKCTECHTLRKKNTKILCLPEFLFQYICQPAQIIKKFIVLFLF
jgi:hypothetical protein